MKLKAELANAMLEGTIARLYVKYGLAMSDSVNQQTGEITRMPVAVEQPDVGPVPIDPGAVPGEAQTTGEPTFAA